MAAKTIFIENHNHTITVTDGAHWESIKPFPGGLFHMGKTPIERGTVNADSSKDRQRVDYPHSGQTAWFENCLLEALPKEASQRFDQLTEHADHEHKSPRFAYAETTDVFAAIHKRAACDNVFDNVPVVHVKAKAAR